MPAHATPTIDGGTTLLLPNRADQQATLAVTGGDLVAGVNLFMRVGDGSAGPAISSVDLVGPGTVFGSEANFGNIDLNPQTPWQGAVGTLLVAVNSTVPADGVLAQITFDTTGVAPGSDWALVFDPIELGTTDFAGTAANLNNGTLRVVTPGDADGDGDVDDADFGIAFAAFTGPDNGPPSNPLVDLDGDDDVDDADFGLAFAAFTGPGVPAAVPEPTSFSLLLVAGLFAARRIR